MRLPLPRCFPVLLVLWPTILATAGAQSGAERNSIDSIFSELAELSPTDPVPPKSRCADYKGTLNRFCQRLLSVKQLERNPDPDLAFATEMGLRDVISDNPKWATAWFALGIARLQLSRAGVTAREGPLQPLGVTTVAGASHAMVRALELEPTFLLGAEALAVIPFPREGASQMGDREDILRLLRHKLDLSPEARLGIAIVEREAGNSDTAITMVREALDAGADSGTAHLELARLLYRVGKADAGRRALIEGASLADTPAARERYKEEIGWVASPQELSEWQATPKDQRSDWLAAFWVDRDVRDGLEPGQRLIEHYTRLEEAMKNFRIVIPQKGRQQFRSVSRADDVAELNGGASEMAEAANSTSSLPASAYAATLGPDSPFRDFGIAQDLIDDRGVVWIRHGKPDERTFTSGGTAMEGWRWSRAPDPDLVLFFAEVDFDGTSGASVLVPTPAGKNGLVINQLCGNAKGMCNELLRFATPAGIVPVTARDGQNPYNTEAGGNSPASANAIRDARDKGRQQIIRGVTTDDFTNKFDESLDPLVQIYGLGANGVGEPNLVVAFAIPGDRLQGTKPPAAGGRTVYPLHFVVMATVKGLPTRFDLDTLRQFAVKEPLGEGQFLTALVQLPVPNGTYSVTAMVEQGSGTGGLARLESVSPPDADKLSISSIVLGRQGSGLVWNSGTKSVPLNPLNAYPPKGEAVIYYQMGGLSTGDDYQTKMEFFEVGKEDKAALAVSFKDRAPAPSMEVERVVDLGNLDEGSFKLRVTVSGPSGEVVQTSYLIIQKQ